MSWTRKVIGSRPLPVARKILPFGEWMPDRPDLANPGSTAASGVFPTVDGYSPVGGLSEQSDALTARCRGAIAAQDTGGNVELYAGDATKLYRLQGGSFGNASGSTYATALDGGWEFAQFGQTVIATNFDDPVQSITVGSATFADLITSTNKPTARHIDTVGDFAVLGNTSDTTDGPQPSRVWWSGINDATDFDPSASTQSDYQDLKGGGWVQRIVGGREYGLVFQERAISRMTYIGPPLIFSFQPIDSNRGTPIPNSVVSWGRMTFFISDEGFFVTDGLQSYPIGHRKVDKTFWDQFDTVDAPRVSAAIDPVNKIVAWAFPGTGNVGSLPNKIFCYNWVEKRWSEIDIETQVLIRATTIGYTLDGLDAVGTDIDDTSVFAFSLDSRSWTGGVVKFAGFNNDNKLVFFDGSNLAATIETTEYTTGKRSLLNNVRPLVDGGTITAAAASRARQIDSVTYGTASSINASGECPLLSEGRYHRVRASIAAGGTWSHAQGMEVYTVDAGDR